MSKTMKIIVGVVAVLVIAAIIIINIKRGSGQTYPVQVEEVKRGKLVHIVSGTGKIQPKVAVKISANVSARIIKLQVDEGDRVQKNDLLVELDRTRYEAAVVQAEANLSSAKATARRQKASMEQALTNYERKKKLFEKGLTSKEILETARTEYEVAKANYEAARDQVTQSKAMLDQAKDDLSKTTIRSPINGIVTKLNKEQGEIALGSQFQEDVILVVSDLSNIEAVVEIDENDVVNVSVEDSARIRVDAFPDSVFIGTVSEIAHSATTKGLGTTEEITNFEVKVTVLDKIRNVRPGMSANVDIVTDTRDNALKVPIQSVTVRENREVEQALAPSSEGKGTNQDSTQKQKKEVASEENGLKEVVFVVKNETAKMQPVQTGIIGETEIEILKGLEEGETVVTGSYRVLSKDLYHDVGVKVKETKEFQSRTRERE